MIGMGTPISHSNMEGIRPSFTAVVRSIIYWGNLGSRIAVKTAEGLLAIR